MLDGAWNAIVCSDRWTGGRERSPAVGLKFEVGESIGAPLNRCERSGLDSNEDIYRAMPKPLTRSDPEPAFPSQVPRDAAGAQNAGHLASEAAFHDRAPRYERELPLVFDEREAA